MRARNLVYDAPNHAAKQSRLRNPKTVFSAPNVHINRPLGYVIWIASRHSLVRHRQGYVLAMTGGAVEKDSASMQNGFSEWTPTGCDLVWASISTERHIPTECAMYMNKKSEISATEFINHLILCLSY